MYWNMPRYENARVKASEVLNALQHNSDEMIRTNDIISTVENMLKVDIKFTKFDFSEFDEVTGKSNSLVDYGAMMLVTNENGKRRAFILLNERETPEMVRFSLVHELGHLVTIDWESLDACHISTHIDMDITSIPETILQDPEYEFLVGEQIANVFALLVLIPYNSLLKAIKKYDSLEDIAEFFGVEKSAIMSRLMLEEK